MGHKGNESNFNEKLLSSAEKQRNSWLDVLRGLAIFGVVSVHSIHTTDVFIAQSVKSSDFSFLMSLGKYGVELFFFLSGWLLASIYGLSGNKVGKPYWVRLVMSDELGDLRIPAFVGFHQASQFVVNDLQGSQFRTMLDPTANFLKGVRS